MKNKNVKTGLSAILHSGLYLQVMVTLTSGIFLVGFAIKLNASNFVIGLLASIPFIGQLVQIPGLYLVEKYRKRKHIFTLFSVFSRGILLVLVVIPFLNNTGLSLFILLTVLLFHSSIGAISACSWNSWVRDFIPEKILGSFFSKRIKLMTGIGIIVSILASIYIDYISKNYKDFEAMGYTSLFVIGALFGIIGVLYMLRVIEPEMKPSNVSLDIKTMLFKPFKNRNYRNLISFLSSWNFAVNLAAPFFIVYMRNRLDISMSMVILLSIVNQIFYFLFIKIWGKFSDKFSNKSILKVSGPLFMFCILAWVFTTMPEKHRFTFHLLLLIHIFTGISTSGVNLAAWNIGLKLAPKGDATSYLATSSVINSIAAGIAPLFGGIFADFFANKELAFDIRWINYGNEFIIQPFNLQQWDFFFLFAFIIGIYSIHRLSLVEESGEVKEKIVINAVFTEVRRNIRNMSSTTGLRYLYQLPYELIKAGFRKIK